MTMNNVLDLSNQNDNNQIRSLSPRQIDTLNNKFKYEEPPRHYVDSLKDTIENVRILNIFFSCWKLTLAYYRMETTLNMI